MRMPVYYFGTFGRPGHYLYTEGMDSVKRNSSSFPYSSLFGGHLDGVLVPSGFPAYKIIVTRFEGIRYTAYSFVDHTGDGRPGSNANFFIPFDREKHDELPDEFEYQVKTWFPQLHSLYKHEGIEFNFAVDDSFKFKLD